MATTTPDPTQDPSQDERPTAAGAGAPGGPLGAFTGLDPWTVGDALTAHLGAVALEAPVLDDAGELVDLRIDYISPDPPEVRGRNQGELVGRRISELYPELDAGFLEACRRVLATGESIVLPVMPYTVRDAGREETIHYEMHLSRLGSGILVAWKELAETDLVLARLTAARREAELRYHALVDADVLGIIYGEGDVILEANEAFLTMLGYDRGVLLAGGLRWPELTPPGWADRDEVGVQELLRTGRMKPWEKQYLHRDGHAVPVLVGGTLLTADPFRWLCFVEDLTEQKATEAALRRTAGRARATAEVADALAELGDDLAPAFDRVVRAVAGQLGDTCIACVLGSDEELLRPVALHDDDPEAVEVLRQGLHDGVPFGPGSTRDLLAGGEPVVVTGGEAMDFAIEVAPGFAPFLRQFGMGAAAVAAMRGAGQVRGLLAVGRRTPGSTFTPGDTRFLQDIGDRCGLALLNQHLLVGQERTARALSRLQRITDATLGELSLDALIDELLRRVQDVLGTDAVRILLLQPDDTLAAGGALGFPLSEDIPIPLGRGVAGRIALADGPVVIPDLSAVEVHSPILRASGLVSLAGVPLRVGDSLIGVLHTSCRTSHVFDDDDLDLLRRAGERIAVAIDRVRAYEAEQAARRRLEFLAEVDSVLTGSLDRDEIMRRVTQAVVPRLGDWCSIHVLRAGSALPDDEVAHVDPEQVARARAVGERVPYDPEAATGVPNVIRTGRTEFYPVIDAALLEEVEADEETARIVDDFALHSMIVVPLPGREQVLGAMQFVMAESHRTYTADDVLLAEEIAARTAAVLETVRLYEEQREIARLLQASLLPATIPYVPGIDVAVRYWAAGDGNEVGGDFYDLFANGDGSWGVVIGDVCGKGPRAATLTGLARHTLRSGARHAADPVTVVEWLNEAILVDHADLYCTAVYARLARPDDGHVQLGLVTAGHPPPVVVHPDGTAEELGRPGNPLGMFDRATLHATAHQLAVGDVVVFYTDGVTDAPPPDWVPPQELLAMAARSAKGASGADEVADRFGAEVARIRPLADRQDDIAILVLRVTEPVPEVAAGGVLALDLGPDDPVAARTARHRVDAWAADHHVPLADREALALIVSELVANALSAAPDGVARLVAELLPVGEGEPLSALLPAPSPAAPVIDGPVVVLTVDNRTTGSRPPEAPTLPDVESVSGRGLFVIEALCDRLEVRDLDDRDGPAVRVRVARRLRG